jgi:hypothetical protein
MGGEDDLNINDIQNEAADMYNPEAVTPEGQRRAEARERQERQERAVSIYPAHARKHAGTKKKWRSGKKRKSSKSKKRKSSKSKKRKSSKSKKSKKQGKSKRSGWF